MGLWNETESPFRSAYDTVDIVKCPRCGSDTYYDDYLDKLVCRQCGGVFDKETKAFAYSFDARDREDAGLPEKDLREFMCRMCGTTFVTRKGTKPAGCSFCGSDDLQEQELRRQFRPDQYIPFKVSREEAVLKLREFAAGKKYVPKSYATEATMSKVTGLYVPFWLIDTDDHLDIKAGATRVNGENAGKRFDINVEYDYKLTGIPFDGGKGINDTLMEAIEPYDYALLKPFDDICLKGYIAERFNETPPDMTQRIIKRLYTYSNQVPAYICRDYTELDIKSNNSTVGDIRQRYVLLPVWFLNYEYEGVRYSFAVNGQTGKVDGDMPVSSERIKRRQLPIKLMLILPFAALVVWAFFMLIFHNDEVSLLFDLIHRYGFFMILFFLGIPLMINNYDITGERTQEMKEFKRGVAEHLSEGIENLPGTVDDLIANVDTACERIMDEAPDIGAYIDTTDSSRLHIEELPLTATKYEDHKRNAR